VTNKTATTTEPDYIVENHGSVFLFIAQTNAAHDNLKENAQEGAQFFGRALVVEHRYAADLAQRLQEEGWLVQ
jgi:carotenoid cleavage dioxygenase-like enzyme